MPHLHVIADVHRPLRRVLAGWMVILGHDCPQTICEFARDYSKARPRAKGRSLAPHSLAATYRRATTDRCSALGLRSAILAQIGTILSRSLRLKGDNASALPYPLPSRHDPNRPDCR